MSRYILPAAIAALLPLHASALDVPGTAPRATTTIDFSTFEEGPLAKLVEGHDGVWRYLIGNPRRTAAIARGFDGSRVLTTANPTDNDIFFAFDARREIAEVHVVPAPADGRMQTSATVTFMGGGDFRPIESCTAIVQPTETRVLTCKAEGTLIQGIQWEEGKIAISKIVHRNV